MGFYIEMVPAPGGKPKEFAERVIPVVFWMLYAIAGFALTCMILAAHQLLGDLLTAGTWFDHALLASLAVFVLGYFVAGLKLAFIRKFISFDSRGVTKGYRFRGVSIWSQSFPWEQIERVYLHNHRPTPNWAVHQHDDSQYHIRGHWQVRLQLRGGREVTLDKHVDREALDPLALEITSFRRAESIGE